MDFVRSMEGQVPGRSLSSNGHCTCNLYLEGPGGGVPVPKVLLELRRIEPSSKEYLGDDTGVAGHDLGFLLCPLRQCQAPATRWVSLCLRLCRLDALEGQCVSSVYF